MAEVFDLVIRGGMIFDGSGGDSFVGDVGIREGRIAQVGDIAAGCGNREIPAEGRIVTPGFVDIHTHYDGQAVWSNRMTPSSAHGVTTVVIGNCGVGFAPCRPADRRVLIETMEGVEDIPGIVMAEGLTWEWESFPEFLDHLESRHWDVDVAAYLPHSPLRVFVMGDRGARREPASAEDLAQMRTLVREAIGAGAIGVASSRLYLHRTHTGEQIPSFEATQPELDSLAGGMADAGAGVFQMVLNGGAAAWEDELSVLVTVAERSGRPAMFTLGTDNTGTRDHLGALRAIEQANARGVSVTGQVLPRPIGIVSGHELTLNPFCLCPSYAALRNLPLEEKLQKLRDPEVRRDIVAERPAPADPISEMVRAWDWIFPLGDVPDYAPDPSQSVGAVARALGVPPEEVAYDMMMRQDGREKLLHAVANFQHGRMDVLHDLLLHPNTVVGLGDGGAHYGMVCDASYPTFLLTYWVRDRNEGKISLPQAVKLLSRDPAISVGLLDRGLIAPGYKADINIIDPHQLTLLGPTIAYDLPGGNRRLDQAAIGYSATILNGEVVHEDDRPTGVYSGRLVRGARKNPKSAQRLLH